MGRLLINIISTNDSGLVGITESGEEVPLSAPKPKSLIININKVYRNLYRKGNIWKKYLEEKDKKAKMGLINRSKKELYLHFGKREFHTTRKNIYLLPYNVYTKRK